jgi:hypothetical protein
VGRRIVGGLSPIVTAPDDRARWVEDDGSDGDVAVGERKTSLGQSRGHRVVVLVDGHTARVARTRTSDLGEERDSTEYPSDATCCGYVRDTPQDVV